MTRFLFPGFKKKALTFSYDDNTEQDRRLACIFRRHGLSATFNINTGSFGEKRWIEHYGFYCEYNRIEEKEVKALYDGFEIASHTVDHVILPQTDKYTFDYQVTADCKKIGELCGKRAVGLAYPCGEYDGGTAERLKELGIHYARTIKNTHSFDLPDNFLEWHPTCHDHDPEIGELTDAFLNGKNDDLKLFYIWGHTFEFDKTDSDRWADMDRLCKKLSGRDDIWYAANSEICDYVTAARSIKELSGVNNTGFDLFAEINGEKTVWKNNGKL